MAAKLSLLKGGARDIVFSSLHKMGPIYIPLNFTSTWAYYTPINKARKSYRVYKCILDHMWFFNTKDHFTNVPTSSGVTIYDTLKSVCRRYVLHMGLFYF